MGPSSQHGTLAPRGNANWTSAPLPHASRSVPVGWLGCVESLRWPTSPPFTPFIPSPPLVSAGRSSSYLPVGPLDHVKVPACRPLTVTDSCPVQRASCPGHRELRPWS